MCERMLYAVACICILAVAIVEPFASESSRTENVIKPNSELKWRGCEKCFMHFALCTYKAYCLSANKYGMHVELHNPPYSPSPLHAIFFTLLSLDQTNSEMMPSNSCTHVKSHGISILSFFLLHVFILSDSNFSYAFYAKHITYA